MTQRRSSDNEKRRSKHSGKEDAAKQRKGSPGNKRRSRMRRKEQGTDKRPLVLAVGLGVLVVAAGGALVILWPEQDPSPTAAGALFRPDDRQVVEQGQYIYRVACAQCHGVNLEGQPNWQQRGADGLMPAPPHDANGHTWHHPDYALFEMTKYGMQRFAGRDYRSAMPAYQRILTDEEIIAVMSYIKSRWPASIRTQHDQINARNAAQSSLHRWDALTALAARSRLTRLT